MPSHSLILPSSQIGVPALNLVGLATDEAYFTGGTATASLDFYASGACQGSGNTESFDAAWLVPQRGGGLYSVRLTIISGTMSGGSATGSWLPMTTNYNWYVTKTGVRGGKQCTYKLELALTTNTAVILATSANVTLTASILNDPPEGGE